MGLDRDAAACVNPLNGEGIDYGLESGRLVAELIADDQDLATAWPALLRTHYGEAFSIARRLACVVTVPGLLRTLGLAGMRLRSRRLRWRCAGWGTSSTTRTATAPRGCGAGQAGGRWPSTRARRSPDPMLE